MNVFWSAFARNRQGLAGCSLVALASLTIVGCGEESPANSNTAATLVGSTTGGSTTGTGGSGATGGTPQTTASQTASTGTTIGATSSGSAGTGATGAGGATATATLTSGEGPNGSCGIQVDSYEVSSAIPTVGIVTWSASSAIDSAVIQFGLPETGLTMSAPVDLSEPGYRTLLLGMKGQHQYDFQIVASSGGQTCNSEILSLMTGAVSNQVPPIDRQVIDEAAIDPGFIVTVAYGNNSPAFIFDADGDPVWWSPAPASASRARMDWEGKYMWMVTGNPMGGRGEMRRVSMDGLDVQTDIPGLEDAHHDFAPLPGGSIAALIHGAGQNGCSAVVEVGPDLGITPIIENVSTIYTPVGDCHPNSILYHPADDTFTISDRNPNMYVKVTREGEVEWQLGGDNPLGPHIPASWSVNHGHHLLDNGNFLLFNNNGAGGGGIGGGSRVLEFQIDYDALTASEVLSYISATNESTGSLGDVQRLSNGNTLVTYSNQGIIHEIDASGNLVQTFTISALGYAMHRKSLYGPPPK